MAFATSSACCMNQIQLLFYSSNFAATSAAQCQKAMKAVHWVAHSDALPNRSFTLVVVVVVVVVVVRAISTTYFVLLGSGKLYPFTLDGGSSFCRRRGPKRNEFSSRSLSHSFGTLPGNCPTDLGAA